MHILVFVLACGGPGVQAPPVAPHGQHAVHEHAEPGGIEGLTLTLDGTAKWQMDDHTRSVMAETRTALKAATVDAPADAVALGEVLQEHGDRLIAGCTMEGAAHDELHVFLMTWFPEVTAIQATKDLDAGRASLERLRALIVEYDRFFE